MKWHHLCNYRHKVETNLESSLKKITAESYRGMP